MQFFFNSSMPRSGSTLLQNILAQNPDIYVSSTSGVLDLIYGARTIFTKAIEFKAQDFETVKQGFKGFCKNGLEGYYKNITDKKIIIDKSRGWIANYDFLSEFYENPKIVCMVRDLRSILASFERLEINNPLLEPLDVDNKELKNTSLYKRIESKLNKPPIGLALNRIYDVLFSKLKKGILFVRYEDLCQWPQETLNEIYNHFGLKSFEHNFLNIQQTTKEDDEVYGIRNLHTIKNYLTKNTNYYQEILGIDISNLVYDSYKWYFDVFKYEK